MSALGELPPREGRSRRPEAAQAEQGGVPLPAALVRRPRCSSRSARWSPRSGSRSRSYNLLSPPKFIGLAELHPDVRGRAPPHRAAGDVHLRVRLGAAAARAWRSSSRSSSTAACADWRSTARRSTCRRCSARASRSRSSGARSSASTGSSTRCSHVFGIEGQGWISNPDTALGTLMILNVWTFGVADGDLPRRPPADPDDVLRGGRRRRRQPAAAALPDHDPAAHADHLLQRWCCS